MSIEIQALSHAYGDKQVFSGVSLRIERAASLTILGPNGSGKTTLLNAVAGLRQAASGSVLYDGVNLNQLTPQQRARLVGYVPQSAVTTFDYRVLDYVVTGCAPQIGAFQRPGPEHYALAKRAIEDMGIAHLAEKSYMRISGGERQQVSIARVLAQRPAYILMDEPTSHLDYGNQILVLNTIRRLAGAGFGVVFTTHNPDQALLLGGQAAILDRAGHLTHGESSALITEATLSTLYNIPLKIRTPDPQGRQVCYAPALRDDATHTP